MLAQGSDIAYERHQPEQTLLYQLVDAHYPALVDQLAQQGKCLPEHVHREFDAYLKCGRLEHGFLRVRCEKCHFERLVAFSCKKRGFCSRFGKFFGLRETMSIDKIPAPPAMPCLFFLYFATILLAVLYWFSILDRFIIGLLVDPIKRDLGISDVQFGLLHGLAFAVTFSLFGLVAGALTDRFSRRWIIFASVTVWSLATAACGTAQHFWQLMPACAYSALNLVTPNNLRGNGIAFFSATVGIIGISLGPILVAGVSDYIFGRNAIGYGLATLIGVCCPIAALLLAGGFKTMREAMVEAESWAEE